MTVIDQFPRRVFLRGLVALGAAGLVARPAIVRASSLDLPPVRHMLEATEAQVRTAMNDLPMPMPPVGSYEICKEYSEDGRYFRPVAYLFDGTAYNQRSGLWEQGLTRETLATRPELLTDSMPKGEWMKRRQGFIDAGGFTYTRSDGIVRDGFNKVNVYGLNSTERKE